MLVFSVFYQGIIIYQSAWGGSHYALLAFMLFFCTWHYRDYFESGKIVLFFSNLTYSVYLFHNWLYDFFLQIYNSKIIALITLFGFCYLCHIFIEKQGILLGKKVFRAWEAKQRSQPMTEIKDIA
jgi:peptidoglycan/LPS O-acetylase OafA/YrhL